MKIIIEKYAKCVLDMIYSSAYYGPIYLQELLSYVSADYSNEEDEKHGGAPFENQSEQEILNNLFCLLEFLVEDTQHFDIYIYTSSDPIKITLKEFIFTMEEKCKEHSLMSDVMNIYLTFDCFVLKKDGNLVVENVNAPSKILNLFSNYMNQINRE